VVLLFTFSRTGLTILGTLIVLSFVMFRSTSQSGDPASKHKLSHNRRSPTTRRSRIRIFLEAVLVICGLITLFVLVGSHNPYFSRFWRYWTEAKTRNRTYLEYIAFDQRFTYWQTAFLMFESQPLLGVGLGNYAFYFDKMLPDRLYRQAEVIRQTTPDEGSDRLITPKNLLARLLAETGILGTATFMTFSISVVGCVLSLWYSRNRSGQIQAAPISDPRWWGSNGILALVACAFVIFSMDSFARPEIWIAFGLITAAAHISGNSEMELLQHE
jgi:O-antigen ligase